MAYKKILAHTPQRKYNNARSVILQLIIKENGKGERKTEK